MYRINKGVTDPAEWAVGRVGVRGSKGSGYHNKESSVHRSCVHSCYRSLMRSGAGDREIVLQDPKAGEIFLPARQLLDRQGHSPARSEPTESDRGKGVYIHKVSLALDSIFISSFISALPG